MFIKYDKIAGAGKGSAPEAMAIKCNKLSLNIKFIRVSPLSDLEFPNFAYHRDTI